jgi:hypothetical protein
LFSALARHPDICPSSVKETCYFLPERYGKNRESAGVYERYFDAADSQKWLLEATPGYLYGGIRLIKAIRQVAGQDTKILVVLREPVSRAFSFFRAKKSLVELPSAITFSEYIDRCLELSQSELAREERNVYFGVEGGKYIDYLQDWMEEFMGNIRIIFFDELVNNQVEVLTDIFNWLGVDSENIQEQKEGEIRENRTMFTRFRILQWFAVRTYRILEVFLRRHRKIKDILTRFYYFLNRGESSGEELDPFEKDRLEEFYRPYNKRLADLLADRNPELPEWLERKN